MITGAVLADHAILVIDVSSFDSAFNTGQIKEHLHIVQSFGVRNIVVAMNKMDLIAWSKEKYNSIVGKLVEFAQGIRLERAQLTFIPISAFHSLNLIDRCK